MSKLHQKLSKFVFAIALTVLPASCMYSNVKHPMGKQTLAEQLENQTVALVEETQDDDDLTPTTRLRTYCSGVWISDDQILTAAHCTADLGKPAAWGRLEQKERLPDWDPTGAEALYAVHADLTPNNEVHKAYKSVVEVFDKEEDLAVVRVDVSDMPKHAIARLSSADLRDGDDVHIVGHPKGVMWTYIRGVISSTRAIPNPNDFTFKVLQISAPVWFGNSGGGAFDADGQLIGIASYITRAPNMSFFVHRDVIRDMLIANRVADYK